MMTLKKSFISKSYVIFYPFDIISNVYHKSNVKLKKKKKKLTSIIYIILILCSLAYSLSHFLNLKKFCLDYQTLGISNAQAKNTRLIQRGTSWIAHISSMAKKPHRYVSLHEQGTRHQTCDTLSFASF